MVGTLILLFGIYLIFSDQVFYGALAIIFAFLIIPNREKSSRRHDFGNDNSSNDSSLSSDNNSGGGDSGGRGGD